MTLSGLNTTENYPVRQPKPKRHSHHSANRRTPTEKIKRSNISGVESKSRRETRKESEKPKKIEQKNKKKQDSTEQQHSISWKELPDFRPNSTRTQTEKKQKMKIPSVLKEPSTCTLEDARNYFQFLATSPSSPVLHQKSPPSQSEIMKIANDFLSNPLTTKLASHSDRRLTNKK